MTDYDFLMLAMMAILCCIWALYLNKMSNRIADIRIERDDARSRVERWAQRVYELEGELQKMPYRNPATGRLEKRPSSHLDTLRSLLHRDGV